MKTKKPATTKKKSAKKQIKKNGTSKPIAKSIKVKNNKNKSGNKKAAPKPAASKKINKNSKNSKTVKKPVKKPVKKTVTKKPAPKNLTTKSLDTKNLNADAALVFSDGKFFLGKILGNIPSKKLAIGEICFNTSITGYQEILTDPSYAGQIITFTFPHIGNIGTNTEDKESIKPVAKGLVLRENITLPSNYRNQNNLTNWLKENNIPGICNVDTRAITRYIRINGAQNAAIYYFGSKKPDIKSVVAELKKYPSLNGMELAATVTSKKEYAWNEPTWEDTISGKNIKPKYKIIAIDYGMKQNILRCLTSCGCEVIAVPATTTAAEIIKHNPDGIFLSNGPGDPEATGKYAIKELQKLIEQQIPLFGICLGHQLLALALGCTTKKMHQGHRGGNHPVKDLATGKVEITSQNHGFVVDQTSLPKDVEITHISLFDNSIEGIKSKTKPVFSVQYHPESSPGPHDSFYLFSRFIELIESTAKKSKKIAS